MTWEVIDILLINQDAKIFAEILAQRMNNFITKYNKTDQRSFMPGRQMANLTKRVLNAINVITKQEMTLSIIGYLKHLISWNGKH